MQLAFQFVPTRQYFVDNVCGGAGPEGVKQQADAFVNDFGPVLAEIHQFLVRGLRPACLELLLSIWQTMTVMT